MTKPGILVVEDERIVAKDIENSLKRLGYAVVGIATSATTALEQTARTTPDLVLMDIKLEGNLDGVEAADQIRQRFGLPVVYLTAYADQEVLNRSKRTEPFGYILKPFQERELHSVIEMALYKHKVERQLKESEARHRELFENNPQPIAVCAPETLAFLEVNPAAIEHYGYSRQEFLGMTLESLRAADDSLAPCALSGRYSTCPDHSIADRHRKKNGTIIDVEVVSHAFAYSGQPARLILITDVSQRKLSENALHQLNAELDQRVGQRTAELVTVNKGLEAFSYSVSHDLRAPLRHISGFSNLLLHHPVITADAGVLRQLKAINAAAHRMDRMIDAFLVLSRIGRAEMHHVRVSLPRLIDSVRLELQPEAVGRNVEWRIGPLPEAVGDPSLLRLALQNLLGNALKYSRDRDPAVIEIGCTCDCGENTVFVRDNGAGFDMRYIGRLFGVFQRLHPEEQFEGTGVGLANVQRIIQRHGGRIWAEGEVDKGATFFITLPEPQSQSAPLRNGVLGAAQPQA